MNDKNMISNPGTNKQDPVFTKGSQPAESAELHQISDFIEIPRKL